MLPANKESCRGVMCEGPGTASGPVTVSERMSVWVGRRQETSPEASDCWPAVRPCERSVLQTMCACVCAHVHMCVYIITYAEQRKCEQSSSWTIRVTSPSSSEINPDTIP